MNPALIGIIAFIVVAIIIVAYIFMSKKEQTPLIVDNSGNVVPETTASSTTSEPTGETVPNTPVSTSSGTNGTSSITSGGTSTTSTTSTSTSTMPPPPPPPPQPVGVKYVRIEKNHIGQTYPTNYSWGNPAGNATIQFAEIEVISNGVNIARKGTATQDSVLGTYGPALAIDGIKTNFINTGRDQDVSWWELKLDHNYLVDKVSIYPRTDCCYQRLGGSKLMLMDENRKVLYKTDIQGINKLQNFSIPAM